MTEMIVKAKRITTQVEEAGVPFVTKLTITAAELSAAGFVAGEDVAVFFFVNMETTNGEVHVRTQVTYDGILGTILGPGIPNRAQYDIGASTRQRSYMYMDWVNLGPALKDFDLDLGASQVIGPSKVFLNKAELIVIRLADLQTENVDWFRDRSTTTVVNTDTYSGTSRASITFTPTAVEDWIVLGSLGYDIDSKDVNHEGRFVLDGAPIAGDWSEEGESSNEAKRFMWIAVIPALSAAAHTVTLETRDDGIDAGNQTDHNQSNLLIFRKDIFEDIYFDEPGNVNLPSATDTQVATITDVFSVAQDAILIGVGNAELLVVDEEAFIWIRKDGATVIDPVVDSASGLASVHLYDSTADPNTSVLAHIALGSGAADLDLFAHQTAVAARDLLDVHFLAWGLELAAGAPTPVAVLTGTVVAAVLESEIVAGGETLIITLTNDTWVATVGDNNAITDALIAGLVSAQVETAGWNAEVRDNMTFAEVVRTSDTVVTITLAAEALYAITADETIEVTVPAIATTGTNVIVATPTFEATNEAPSATLAGTLANGAFESEIVAGGQTLIITLTGATWEPTVGADNAITDALIAGLVSDSAEAFAWNAVVQANLTFAEVTRTSDTVVTIVLLAEPTYEISPANETITVTVPDSAILNQAGMVATPTFLIEDDTVVDVPGVYEEGTKGHRRSVTAAADFSDGSGRFRFIQEDGTLAGAGEEALGVLQDKPNIGEFGLVFYGGISKVIAGSDVPTNNLNVGDPVAADATGAGILAQSGDRVLGHLADGSGQFVTAAGGVMAVALGSRGILP